MVSSCWSTPPYAVGGPAACLLALTLVVALPVRAADTVELYAVHEASAEFTMGFESMRHIASDREVSNELLFGHGLGSRVATYVGACFVPDQEFRIDSTDYFVGLMGAAVQTDHFDVDLVLDLSGLASAMHELVFAPMIELNLDRDPRMQTWGAYLRAGLPMWRESTVHADGRVSREQRVDLALNPGCYFTLSDRHQVLIEYATDVRLAEPDGDRTTPGHIALGLNTVLSEPLEIITQLHVALPQDGGRAEVGAALGFVATLPGAF